MKIEHLNYEPQSYNDILLDKLYKICPACFTEKRDPIDGKLLRSIDFDKLKELLGVKYTDETNETYGFDWVGKSNAKREASTPINKTLRPCIEESVDWYSTKNLYIEGDNLQVLKLLQNSYMGKIKMIYIDPPYNTGNDFIYQDNFVTDYNQFEQKYRINSNGDQLFSQKSFRQNTSTNGRFHSDWCSMIYSRLLIAKNLLSKDGLIFISIDDNEQCSLKNICNEVFGEKNFKAQLIWASNGHSDNQYDIKVNHEYILVYGKDYLADSVGYIIDPNVPKESNLWKGYAENSITKNGEANPPSRIILKAGFPCSEQNLTLLSNKPDNDFYSEINKIGYISRQITEKFNVSYPIREHNISVSNFKLEEDVPMFSGWANANKLKRFIDGGFKPLQESDGSCYFYLSKNGVIYYKKERTKARNILSVLQNFGTTEQMRSELEKEGIYFSYPKPVKLLNYLLKIGANTKDAIILDFFAGSATTAEACFQLNAEDGGHRQFILVQLPESIDPKSEAYKHGFTNISEISKERIRKTALKYKNTSNLDLGFRVFKCDESNLKDIYFDPKNLIQEDLLKYVDNIKDDRTDLDLLFDCMLKWGVQLSEPISKTKIGECTIYNINEGNLVACFSSNISEAVITAIAEMNPLRVVFRDNSFNEVSNKMNLFEIFKQKCFWSDEEVYMNIKVI